MTVPTRLAAFALVLAAAFGVGSALGAAVGPVDAGDGEAPQHEPGPHGEGHP